LSVYKCACCGSIHDPNIHDPNIHDPNIHDPDLLPQYCNICFYSIPKHIPLEQHEKYLISLKKENYD